MKKTNSHSLKSVGVIGGVGPETTAEFYLGVIFRCQQLNNKQRPSILIGSLPLAFQIERDLIASNTGIERYIPFLQDEARKLEKAGADFLVMPCNSLHVFVDEIRSAVSIPMVSIVEETIKYLKRSGISKVGLISTSATILNQVYETKLKESGIGFVTPNRIQRKRIDQIIQRLVDGTHSDDDRQFLIDVADRLSESGVTHVALACTDLQLLSPVSEKVVIFDTMKILADSTVSNILG